jgi:aspartokinase
LTFEIQGLFAGFSFLTVLELIVYFFVPPSKILSRRSTKVVPFQTNSNPTRLKKNLKKPAEFLNSFMKKSTIHGLSHASISKSTVEKIFWLISFFVSLVLCGILLNDLHKKYSKSMVTVSFDGDLQSIKNVGKKMIWMIGALPEFFLDSVSCSHFSPWNGL